jgi:hypothetical protein
MTLTVATALTHFKVQTKRAHAKTKDAVYIKITPWHGICYGKLKMTGRNVHSKRLSVAIGTASHA